MSIPPSPPPSPFWQRALPFAALAATLIVLTAAILRANDGHFGYTLDDPYIHLALSENIANGHFGIEPDRPSAPSSSVAWPFLLAPLAGTAVHVFVPLALGILALFASAWLLSQVLEEAGLTGGGRAGLFRAGLIFGTPLVLNCIGVVFTGMEHSLAIAFVMAGVLGLARLQRTGKINRWLIAGIVLGPLVRYENLVFSAGALLALVILGRWKKGVLLGALMLLPLALFSIFLVSNDLAWLPSSIRTKSQVVNGSSFAAIYEALARNVEIALYNDQGRGLFALALLFLSRLFFDRSRASIAFVVAAVTPIAGHILGGRYGWFGRYEVYALMGGFALLFLVHREALNFIGRRVPAVLALALVFCVPAFTMPGLWRTTKRTPQAASEIYRQQYQLHRLAIAWGRPIALNDVGWASFQNDERILDIYGLCDDAVRELRFGDDPAWLGDLLDREGVHAAALFEDPPPWFGDAIPERWIRVGDLRLAGWRVLKVPSRVGVYATRPGDVEGLSQALRSLRESAPSRVEVRIKGE